jgi:tetratricopeptide (TPR) repeat protein
MGTEFKDVSNAFAGARKTGDFDAAEQVMLDWLSEPRSRTNRNLVFLSACQLAQSCGLDNKALEYANQVLEEFPSGITARHVKALSYFRLGKLPEAESMIRDALEIAEREDPLNIFVMTTLLGKILNAQNRSKEAEAVLTLADSHSLPSDIFVISRHKVLSETYTFMGDMHKARQHLLTALRLVDDVSSDALKYLLQGEWLDALSAIERG